MAFVFSKSTPATGAVAMYNLKECLKTAGWTVPSSSDGTTYNASGDQITTGASGAGGMANNSAWFRIVSPNSVIEFTVQRGTGNTVWRVKRAWSQTFTGGSPGATQTPSGTNQVIIMGGGTDGSPTYNTFFGADAGYRWNVGADNASPYGFWAGAFPSGGGDPSACLISDPLTGGEPTDADKYLTIFANSGQNPFHLNSMTTEAGTTTTCILLGSLISTTPTTYTQFPALYYITYVGAGGNLVCPGALPANPITAYEEMLPIIYSRRGVLGDPGMKGISTLMRWCGTTRSTGDTFTLSTTRDRIVYRQVHLPWDGTVPVV